MHLFLVEVHRDAGCIERDTHSSPLTTSCIAKAHDVRRASPSTS